MTASTHMVSVTVTPGVASDLTASPGLHQAGPWYKDTKNPYTLMLRENLQVTPTGSQFETSSYKVYIKAIPREPIGKAIP